MLRLRTILTAVAVPAVLGGALLATSQPAHAWPGNPNVTVTGKLTGCSTAGPYNIASVRANLNGEIRTWSSNGWYSQPPTYALRFDNVPGGAGGWIWAVVHCTVNRPDYGVWIKIQQPWVGDTWPGGNI
jgi:hypothetical protein